MFFFNFQPKAFLWDWLNQSKILFLIDLLGLRGTLYDCTSTSRGSRNPFEPYQSHVKNYLIPDADVSTGLNGTFPDGRLVGLCFVSGTLLKNKYDTSTCSLAFTVVLTCDGGCFATFDFSSANDESRSVDCKLYRRTNDVLQFFQINKQTSVLIHETDNCV